MSNPLTTGWNNATGICGGAQNTTCSTPQIHEQIGKLRHLVEENLKLQEELEGKLALVVEAKQDDKNACPTPEPTLVPLASELREFNKKLSDLSSFKRSLIRRIAL